MKTLYLLRHSVTDYNKQRRLFGVSDVPLNEEGLQLVHKTKHKFLNKGIQGIISSDLLRAYQTAKIIADFLNVPVYKSELLRERDQGIYEGLLLEEINKFEKNLSFTSKVEGSESLKSFIDRTRIIFNSIVNDIAWDKFIVVSHNGPLKMFMATCLKLHIKRWGLCQSKVVYYDTQNQEWVTNESNQGP